MRIWAAPTGFRGLLQTTTRGLEVREGVVRAGLIKYIVCMYKTFKELIKILYLN